MEGYKAERYPEANDIRAMAIAEAVSRYEAGQYDAAANALASWVRRAPDDATPLRLRGLALTRAGRVREALPLLSRSRALAFADPLSHLHYGIALQEQRCFARAAALFRRAASMAPGMPAAWINLCVSLTSLGQPRAARAAARRAIALAPRDADAHYALGAAEAADGNPEGAATAFFDAIALRPTFADAWLNLGLAHYRLGNMAAAIEAMTAASRANPAHGAAEANLCAFQMLVGDADEAIARLRDIIARDPLCIPARMNLANALLLERDAEAALAVLDLSGLGIQQPDGREGAHWRAHRALALLLLARFEEARAELDSIATPYDAEIRILWRRISLALHDGDTAAAEALAARMADLAEDDSAALAEHRIIGHFDLARFHLARGRPRQAFAHWRGGHRLLAHFQPFSRAGHAEFIDASIAAYSRRRLHEGPRAANHDPAPVFIVGLPRSGTTLVEQILAAHPRVHGAGERPAIYAALRRIATRPYDAERIEALAALGAETLTAEANAFLGTLHALAPRASLVVDKMPVNALHLGFIATLLPGARFILCGRDPRDTGLSIFQHRFFGYHPYAHDLGDLGWYIGQHARLMAHWREALPRPILQVNLGDWVSDFPATLARVLAFLDLPHDPACERFYESDRRVRTASAAQVREPINARGIGRWREFADELAPMIAELEAAGLC